MTEPVQVKLTAREHALHQAGHRLGYVKGLEMAAGQLVETGERYRKQLKSSKMTKKQRKEADLWVNVFDQLAEHLKKAAVQPAAEGQLALNSALSMETVVTSNGKSPGKLRKVAQAIDRALADD